MKGRNSPKRKAKLVEPIMTRVPRKTQIEFVAAGVKTTAPDAEAVRLSLDEAMHRYDPGTSLGILLDHAEHMARAAKESRLAPEYVNAGAHPANQHLASGILGQVADLRKLLCERPDLVSVVFDAWWLAIDVADLERNLGDSRAVHAFRAVERQRLNNLAAAIESDEKDRQRFKKLADKFVAAHSRPSYASVKGHIVRNTGAPPGRVERLYPRKSLKSVRS